MNELEETQGQWQTFLRNSAVRTQPTPQQGPEPFPRIDVDFAEAVPVVISGVLTRSMAHRLAAVAPFLQAAVDVLFVNVNQRSLGDRPLDERADRQLFHVLQHPKHDLASALEHSANRRLFLLECATAPIPRRSCWTIDRALLRLRSSSLAICKLDKFRPMKYKQMT